jgi:hypothetical protein
MPRNFPESRGFLLAFKTDISSLLELRPRGGGRRALFVVPCSNPPKKRPKRGRLRFGGNLSLTIG